MSGEATPRPWFVVGPPWNDYGPALIYSGSEDPHVGNLVADTESSLNPEADAALIVEAVNAYDRLRAIEAAAQAALDAWNAGWDAVDHETNTTKAVASMEAEKEAFAALRSALDPSPSAKETKP